ncbi:unnamed protein product [Lepidochelys kempii]
MGSAERTSKAAKGRKQRQMEESVLHHTEPALQQLSSTATPGLLGPMELDPILAACGWPASSPFGVLCCFLRLLRFYEPALSCLAFLLLAFCLQRTIAVAIQVSASSEKTLKAFEIYESPHHVRVMMSMKEKLLFV